MTRTMAARLVALALTAGLALVAGPAVAAGPAGVAECLIEGDRVPAADMARARAACEVARGRFAGLMGEPVPDVVVLVEERQGYRIGILEGRAVVLWPSSEVMVRQVGDGPGTRAYVEHQWRETLPHEIAHALTAAYFFPDGQFESTGYGTPLPDWFEEAMAIWAEPLASRDSRLAAARRLPAYRLDLGRILSMRHPAAGNDAALAVRDGALPPPDQALWDFYQQSLAVLAFIHDLGGPAAVRELASRLVTGAPGPDALAGLPGLPATFDEVTAAWRAWLDRSS
jgi:hypothetical protein